MDIPKSNIKYSLCFIVLLCILPDDVSSTRSSIKCFDCRSDLDLKCGDPFDNSTIPLTSCELREHPPGVILACKKAWIKVNGKHVISRGCSWKQPDDILNSCNDTRPDPNENITLTSCITCDNRDGCNGASTTVTKAVIALLLVPLGLLFLKEI